MNTHLSEELRSLLAEGKDFAISIFEENGSVPATALVETASNLYLIGMESNHGPEAKKAFRDAVQEMVNAENATGVCVISEVWYTTEVDSDPKAKTKREGLLVCAENALGETGAFIAEIRREDMRIEIGEWNVFLPPVNGVFTGFFKIVKPALLN